VGCPLSVGDGMGVERICNWVKLNRLFNISTS